MTLISLNMIVRDCQQDLAQCLESVKGVFDEVVVVDTGSKDNTIEVALKYGARVFEFQWCDDFSAARNFARSKSSYEWTFWLDHDDVITPDNVQKLLELKKQELTADMYIFHYDYAQDQFGNTLSPDLYRERLVKRHNQWKYRIHEVTPLIGTTKRVDISVKHTRKHANTARNIQMLEQAIKLDRDVRYVGYLAKELKDVGQYHRAYGLYNEFISMPGWEHNDDTIQAKTNLLELKQKLGLLTQDDKVELALWSAKRANDRCDSLDVRTRGMVKSP